MRQRLRITAATALLVALSTVPTGGSRSPTIRAEARRLSMGCVYAIEAYGRDAVVLQEALDAALDEVDRIDRLMSHYRADSPLSRLNREAGRGPVPIDAELFDFLAAALRFSAASGGAFDITVGPLLKAWGFFDGDGRVPGDGEIATLRERVGYRHVVLDRLHRTVRFTRAGVELDLGGIAKGYAVDRAAGVLERHGAAAALISAGGSTLYAIGAPPNRRGWDVSVQDPRDPRGIALTVSLVNRALSVAGSSEKSFETDGVEYSHIMDPRTGRPVRGVLTVAVLGDTGTSTDALDTALFVQGVATGRGLLERYPGSEAYFLLPAADAPWTLVHLP